MPKEFNNHLAIYTVIIGDYDTIKQPQVITSGADFYLFTNNQRIKDAGVWNVVYLDESDSAEEHENVAVQDKMMDCIKDSKRIKNILLSRKVKMLAHKYLPSRYEKSIYLDADMLIKSDLSSLFDLLNGDALMAAFRHSYCCSVRDEIDDLEKRGVVEQDVVENQWQRYLKWGYMDDIGVTENGILIRRHNHPKVVELMELWWQEYLQ